MCLIGWLTAELVTHGNASQWLPNCADHARPIRNNWRFPANYSKKTNKTNQERIVTYRWPDRSPFCFRLECTDSSSVALGTSDCHDTLPIPGNLSHRTEHPFCNQSKRCIRDGQIMPLNWTKLGEGLGDWNLPLSNNNRTGMMNTFVPSPWGFPCPVDMVWVCGPRVYLYLPPRWCGTCHLARLVPPAVVIPEQNVTTHKNEQGHVHSRNKKGHLRTPHGHKRGQLSYIWSTGFLYVSVSSLSGYSNRRPSESVMVDIGRVNRGGTNADQAD